MACKSGQGGRDALHLQAADGPGPHRLVLQPYLSAQDASIRSTRCSKVMMASERGDTGTAHRYRTCSAGFMDLIYRPWEILESEVLFNTQHSNGMGKPPIAVPCFRLFISSELNQHQQISISPVQDLT